VPGGDSQVVHNTITRWNVDDGEAHGVTVVPMDWSTDTAADYGVRPQGSINEQLVDRADVVLAIFWTRLGSPIWQSRFGHR
jgi:hypothetical protein